MIHWGRPIKTKVGPTLTQNTHLGTQTHVVHCSQHRNGTVRRTKSTHITDRNWKSHITYIITYIITEKTEMWSIRSREGPEMVTTPPKVKIYARVWKGPLMRENYIPQILTIFRKPSDFMRAILEYKWTNPLKHVEKFSYTWNKFSQKFGTKLHAAVLRTWNFDDKFTNLNGTPSRSLGAVRRDCMTLHAAHPRG